MDSVYSDGILPVLPSNYPSSADIFLRNVTNSHHSHVSNPVSPFPPHQEYFTQSEHLLVQSSSIQIACIDTGNINRNSHT